MNTQHYTAYYALMEVAKRRGIPLTAVIQSIEDAIKEAYSDAVAKKPQSVRPGWIFPAREISHRQLN